MLEKAGFAVSVPKETVCCGRPLYDFGMLDRAKEYLHNAIDVLQREMSSEVPIVILEPGCASVFRDELNNLLLRNGAAQGLSQRTFLLGEFLHKFAPDFSPPKLNPSRKAIVHGHCHQKAIMGQDNEVEWLKKMGIDADVLDSGCCGMAGSFGFEKEKYDVSVKCGELVLLPEVRRARPEDLIVANGFSCQEQIAQLTDRHALHLAQVFQMALHAKAANGPHPETNYIRGRQYVVNASMWRAGAAAIIGATAVSVAAWMINRWLTDRRPA